tara:strand:- start:493 stop:648 length:156 start_codon:yes stop_codon:yes gene_type:complete
VEKVFLNFFYISKNNIGIGETSLQIMKNIKSLEIIFLSPVDFKDKKCYQAL